MFTPTDTNDYSTVTDTVSIAILTNFLDGLAAYYQFESNGLDSFTNHLDLTLFGSPGFAPGLFGMALDLHHDLNQYAQRLVDDAAFDFGTNDFTIQVWINLYEFGEYEQTFIEKFAGDNGPGWTFTSPGFLLFAASGGAVYISGTANVSTNVWHHLVVRRSGATFTLFFDDTVIATGSTGAAVTTTSNGLLIGKRNPQDGRDFSVNGRLDEVAIWNRALADGEITTLYNGGQGMPLSSPLLPQIIAPPTNQTALPGTTVEFTVVATGPAPLSYQWLFDGTNLTDNAQITGSQSNVLTLTSVTIGNAGTYEVVVSNAYGSNSAFATLTVAQMIPIITWTNPGAIPYGMALTSNQLDATANVPGSFAYNPTNGAVLDAGTNTLSVIFTPTDTVDYSNVTNTVSLVVSPAPLTVTANNATRHTARPTRCSQDQAADCSTAITLQRPSFAAPSR